MNKSKSYTSPVELFVDAVKGENLSFGDLRLLTSGLMSLLRESDNPLHENELKAVCSMIASVGTTQKVSEKTVGAVTTTALYGMKDIKETPSRAYADAIECLVGLQMDKLVN